MTVEELIKVLDRELIFEVLQAYNREVIFDSSEYNDKENKQKWKTVKDRIVYEIYPSDTRELLIYVYPDFIEPEKCQ